MLKTLRPLCLGESREKLFFMGYLHPTRDHLPKYYSRLMKAA